MKRSSRKLGLLLLLLQLLLAPSFAVGQAGFVPESRDQTALDRLIAETRSLTDPGERIVAISARLLDSPYVAHPLVGGPDRPERLVTDLTGFDCFTLLDTVEALRRAENAAAFPDRLREVRYRGGKVGYATRRHFFSDWVAAPDSPIVDVTRTIGGERVRIRRLQLNRRADGGLWVPGVPVVARTIADIPADQVDDAVLAALRPGDYVGFSSELDGLDVSHVGLVVVRDGEVWLRHASSRRETGRIVDEALTGVLDDHGGLVIYRAVR